MNDNDSSGVQSDVWGARAWDLAEIEDEGPRQLFQVILDAASVGKDTKLLDIGCVSGLASAMATRLGAKVSGLDSPHRIFSRLRRSAYLMAILVWIWMT